MNDDENPPERDDPERDALDTGHLPATLDEFRALRKKQQSVTLIDHVERVVKEKYEDPKFKRLLDTKSNATSVTGTVVGDRYKAAGMLWEHAKATNDRDVADELEHEIKKAIERVLKRYGVSLNDHKRRLLASKNGK